jgi:hypothetical protein
MRNDRQTPENPDPAIELPAVKDAPDLQNSGDNVKGACQQPGEDYLHIGIPNDLMIVLFNRTTSRCDSL